MKTSNPLFISKNPFFNMNEFLLVFLKEKECCVTFFLLSFSWVPQKEFLKKNKNKKHKKTKKKTGTNLWQHSWPFFLLKKNKQKFIRNVTFWRCKHFNFCEGSAICTVSNVDFAFGGGVYHYYNFSLKSIFFVFGKLLVLYKLWESKLKVKEIDCTWYLANGAHSLHNLFLGR